MKKEDDISFLEMGCLYEFTWYSGTKMFMYLISIEKFCGGQIYLTYLNKDGIRPMYFYLNDGYAGNSKRWTKID
jgi:hypothetical protein